MSSNVLVIGGGGREHALCWKLAQSPSVGRVYVCPGNGGTQTGSKVTNAVVDLKEFSNVVEWCESRNVHLVVVGPEEPLAAGISDTLRDEGIPCFGPSAQAAQIEASKAFSKDFMDRYSIPTARWKAFSDSKQACHYINSADFPALVVKASGLAAGKGVVVTSSKEEACMVAKHILEDKRFGCAGDTIIVEELLEGEEISCLAFSDGKVIAVMPPAQDHKRLGEGDTGPNTGGMGAYCPYTKLSDVDRQYIGKDILLKVVEGMKFDGTPYIGVLYSGLMLTKDGPKVLEFNCRFGDPETQVILPLLVSDLYQVLYSCVAGELATNLPVFSTDRTAVAVVLASGGYPGTYKKGLEITGITAATSNANCLVFHAGTSSKDDKLVTSGGRVLAVVAVHSDLPEAIQHANTAAQAIEFDGVYFRKDIANKAMIMPPKAIGLQYQDAGVNIAAGDCLVQAIKPLARATSRRGCDADLGMFGGLFDIKASGYVDPLLVSGTDGVGTKLKVAQACGIHDTIGIDLVAMCVNDVLAHGAEPLFFLDYFACGNLNVNTAKQVISGIAQGCQQAGCALLGGETAEMPGMYTQCEYDVAGFAVGAVERDNLLPVTNQIQVGDVIVGLASSGLHSNGFSLVRKVLAQSRIKCGDVCPFDAEKTLGESLLAPTKIYSKRFLPVATSVKAFAHITGGGLIENIPRVLPSSMGVCLDASSWTVHPVFGWLSQVGKIETREMAKTFNCGIGAVLVLDPSKVSFVVSKLRQANEDCAIIGHVKSAKEGEERVTIHNLDIALSNAHQSDVLRGQKLPGRVKTKVGVLISGTGTNLQALIDHTLDPSKDSQAEIVIVMSNVPDVKGLGRAAKAGIPTKVIPHKNYESRVEFDRELTAELERAGVQLICLAGFMRILSGEFVQKWTGHILNIHPSLLPSFKGANAHSMALKAGVRLSGCTVHFVVEKVDDGAILAQEAVPVLQGDTVDTLSERIKVAEHNLFPVAMELVASNMAWLGHDGKIQWA